MKAAGLEIGIHLATIKNFLMLNYLGVKEMGQRVVVFKLGFECSIGDLWTEGLHPNLTPVKPVQRSRKKANEVPSFSNYSCKVKRNGRFGRFQDYLASSATFHCQISLVLQKKATQLFFVVVSVISRKVVPANYPPL